MTNLSKKGNLGKGLPQIEDGINNATAVMRDNSFLELPDYGNSKFEAGKKVIIYPDEIYVEQIGKKKVYFIPVSDLSVPISKQEHVPLPLWMCKFYRGQINGIIETAKQHGITLKKYYFYKQRMMCAV